MFISYINVTVLYYRPYWRCYYSNTDAIIYVVDSRDRGTVHHTMSTAEVSVSDPVNSTAKRPAYWMRKVAFSNYCGYKAMVYLKRSSSPSPKSSGFSDDWFSYNSLESLAILASIFLVSQQQSMKFCKGLRNCVGILLFLS